MTRPSPAPHDTLDLHTASRDALSFALLAAREELRDLREECARLHMQAQQARLGEAVGRSLFSGDNR